MTDAQLLAFMNDVRSIPTYKRKGTWSAKIRTIYEGGEGPRLAPSEHFYMSYATYGGTTEEVPLPLIRRLEAEGKLVRAYPDQPHINAWILPQ